VGSITVHAVWSVGSWTNPGGGESTLTEVWNGSEWQLIDSPNGAGDVNVLWGVDGASPTEVWAVGYSSLEIDTPDLANLLMLRGDGKTWAIEPIPALGASSALAAVHLVSPSDGWAVGTYRPSRDTVAHGLILHWDGAAWTQVVAPAFEGGAVRLTGGSGTAGDDVWAVGYHERGPGQEDQVILHWTGQSWRAVPGPTLDSTIRTALFSVTAVSKSDAWAVGYSHPAGLSDEENLEPLAIRWNGKDWIRIASAGTQPDPGPTKPALVTRPGPAPVPSPGEALGGVQLRSVLVHDNVWVAGYRVDGGGEHEIVMIFDGHQFVPEVLPAPGTEPNGNVTGTALSAISVNPTAGALWTVGWVSTPARIGHGSNILTRPVRATKP